MSPLSWQHRALSLYACGLALAMNMFQFVILQLDRGQGYATAFGHKDSRGMQVPAACQLFNSLVTVLSCFHEMNLIVLNAVVFIHQSYGNANGMFKLCRSCWQQRLRSTSCKTLQAAEQAPHCPPHRFLDVIYCLVCLHHQAAIHYKSKQLLEAPCFPPFLPPLKHINTQL